MYYFRTEANRLRQFWFGRMFLNPRHGRVGMSSNQGRRSRYLMVEYRVGRAKEAVMLVNAATVTSGAF